MAHYAYQRVREHKSMPGVIEIAGDLPVRAVIEDVLFLAEYSEPAEWEGQVIYLPL
jgi:hypothetical protein